MVLEAGQDRTFVVSADEVGYGPDDSVVGDGSPLTRPATYHGKTPAEVHTKLDAAADRRRQELPVQARPR